VILVENIGVTSWRKKFWNCYCGKLLHWRQVYRNRRNSC